MAFTLRILLRMAFAATVFFSVFAAVDIMNAQAVINAYGQLFPYSFLSLAQSAFLALAPITVLWFSVERLRAKAAGSFGRMLLEGLGVTLIIFLVSIIIAANCAGGGDSCLGMEILPVIVLIGGGAAAGLVAFVVSLRKEGGSFEKDGKMTE